MPFQIHYPVDTAKRCEGTAFFELATYTFPWNAFIGSELSFSIRAYRSLPLCDAVGLLSGTDSTGLVVWNGALALLEWLFLHPSQLESVLSREGNGAALLFVELGCGSGVVAVGLFALMQLLHRRHLMPAVASVSYIATDGSTESVELTQRNIGEQCSGDKPDGLSTTMHAMCLHWGVEQDVFSLVSSAASPTTSAPLSLIIVSADVIYDVEAVPLLISTVSDLAAQYRGRPSQPLYNAKWWLLYTPRSLTRESNIAIYQRLMDGLEQQNWSYEVQLLPQGSCPTGMEADDTKDTPALQGCVFVISI